MKIALYVAALAILAGLVGGLIHMAKKASRVDSAEAAQHEAERKQVEQAERFAKSIQDFTKQQAQDRAADEALASRLAALEGVSQDLSRAARRQPSTVEKTDDKGISRAVINPGWWLCQSAILGGDTSDAAACSASPGNGVLSPPVSP